MRGDRLYPLNEIKDIFPEIYDEAIKKYKDREFVMEQKIPFLNCLWNDVIHLSAVNPAEIKELLSEIGGEMKARRFYQIDPYLLEKEKTIIYLHAHKIYEEKLDQKNFTQYNPEKVFEYSIIPEETKKYYKREIAAGNRPLLWHRIPHFFYRGSLDITKLKILEL